MVNDIILWQQSAITMGETILSHNGCIVKHGDKTYQELFDSIFDNHKSGVMLYKDDSLQIYERQQSYLVFSNLEERDEHNRRIAFAARIGTVSKVKVIPLLLHELSLQNKTLSKQKQLLLHLAIYRREIIASICLFLAIIVSITLIKFLK